MAARKKKTNKKKTGKKAVAKRGTTALATSSWAERMALMAKDTGEREKPGGGGLWISTRNGEFSLGDDIIGDTMQVVVLDFAFDNALYGHVDKNDNFIPDDYDPNNPVTPTCFAISRVEDDLVPHDDCEDPQEQNCESCWANAWESGDKGKGKACKNSRRLVMVAADDLDDFSADSDVAYMRLPPASLQYWKSYANKLDKVKNLPPAGVITELTAERNPKGTGFVIKAVMVDEITDPGMQEVVGELLDNLGDDILMPYQKRAEEGEEKPVRGRRGASKKKVSNKKTPTKKRGSKKKASSRRPTRKY